MNKNKKTITSPFFILFIVSILNTIQVADVVSNNPNHVVSVAVVGGKQWRKQKINAMIKQKWKSKIKTTMSDKIFSCNNSTEIMVYVNSTKNRTQNCPKCLL